MSLRNQLTWKMRGVLGEVALHAQPVPEVIAHVVAAEGKHGHGIAADGADFAAGGGRGFGAHGGAGVDAGRPVEGLVDERHGGGRRPPKMMAEMGTPAGSSQEGSMVGHCEAGAVKRPLGWAAGVGESGVHGLPRQSSASAGGGVGHAFPPDVAGRVCRRG